MTTRSVLKSIAFVAVGAVVIAVVTFGWLSFVPRHVPPGQPALSTLRADSLPDFQAAFNAFEGEVRVIAMFSPT